jgi:hypothetical protein
MKSQFDAILANFMDKKEDMLVKKNPQVKVFNSNQFEMDDNEFSEENESPD